MVVIVTAYATIDSAVEAIKRGAADYLAKPFTPAQIRHVVDQSVKQRDIKRQLPTWKAACARPRRRPIWNPTRPKSARL